MAKLTGIPYVTGTSDALNVELLLDMMLAQNPGTQTVGLLYSTSEVNSAPAIEDAKAYLDSKGIGYLEKTGNTSDEIIAAVSSMTGQVDAVFTPTDNVVQAAELAIAPTLAEAGIPHYNAPTPLSATGLFATCGVNYTDLGSQTADLAVEVLHHWPDPWSMSPWPGTSSPSTPRPPPPWARTTPDLSVWDPSWWRSRPLRTEGFPACDPGRTLRPGRRVRPRCM